MHLPNLNAALKFYNKGIATEVSEVMALWMRLYPYPLTEMAQEPTHPQMSKLIVCMAGVKVKVKVRDIRLRSTPNPPVEMIEKLIHIV